MARRFYGSPQGTRISCASLRLLKHQILHCVLSSFQQYNLLSAFPNTIMEANEGQADASSHQVSLSNPLDFTETSMIILEEFDRSMGVTISYFDLLRDACHRLHRDGLQ